MASAAGSDATPARPRSRATLASFTLMLMMNLSAATSACATAQPTASRRRTALASFALVRGDGRFGGSGGTCVCAERYTMEDLCGDFSNFSEDLAVASNSAKLLVFVVEVLGGVCVSGGSCDEFNGYAMRCFVGGGVNGWFSCGSCGYAVPDYLGLPRRRQRRHLRLHCFGVSFGMIARLALAFFTLGRLGPPGTS